MPTPIKLNALIEDKSNLDMQRSFLKSENYRLLSFLGMATPFEEIQLGYIKKALLYDKKGDNGCLIVSISNNRNLSYKAKQILRKYVSKQDDRKLLHYSCFTDFNFSSFIVNTKIADQKKIGRAFGFTSLVASDNNISPETHQKILVNLNDFLFTCGYEALIYLKYTSTNGTPKLINSSFAIDMKRLIINFKKNKSLNDFTKDLVKDLDAHLIEILRGE